MDATKTCCETHAVNMRMLSTPTRAMHSLTSAVGSERVAKVVIVPAEYSPRRSESRRNPPGCGNSSLVAPVKYCGGTRADQETCQWLRNDLGHISGCSASSICGSCDDTKDEMSELSPLEKSAP